MNLGRTPEEIENERKRLLIFAFSILGNLLLATFGVVSFVNARYFLGAMLFLSTLGVSLIAYTSTRLKSAQLACLVLAGTLFLLACFLTLGGGAEGTGPFWSYGITMLMVLLVGPKIGVVYMAAYLVVIGIGLFGDHPSVYPYSDIVATRIFSASISLYALVLTSEWIRVMSYGAITLTSEGHRQLANTDPLTQLMNRYGLQTQLRAKPEQSEGVVVMLDVDNFKTINDNHGHDAGDMVLVRLANVLELHTKGRDLVARWGGEEFVMVLFDTPIEQATKLVQQIQFKFKQEHFDLNGSKTQITFSAGLARMASIADFEAAIKAADIKLYEAKDAGRDQVFAE